MALIVIILILLIIVALVLMGKMSIFAYKPIYKTGGTSESYVQFWKIIKEGICSGTFIIVCNDSNKQKIQNNDWNINWEEEIKSFLNLVGELKPITAIISGDDRRFKGKIDSDSSILENHKITSVTNNGRLNENARNFVINQLDKLYQYTGDTEQSEIKNILKEIRKCADNDKKINSSPSSPSSASSPSLSPSPSQSSTAPSSPSSPLQPSPSQSPTPPSPLSSAVLSQPPTPSPSSQPSPSSPSQPSSSSPSQPSPLSPSSPSSAPLLSSVTIGSTTGSTGTSSVLVSTTPINSQLESVESEYLEDMAQVMNKSPNGSVSNVAQRISENKNVHDSKSAYKSISNNFAILEKTNVRAVQKEHRAELG